MKKPLAITATALMLALGGVNMAHASDLYTQEISAAKEIKQGGKVKITFAASSSPISSGRMPVDSTMFVLKLSDSAEHAGWRIYPQGGSKGGYMYGTESSVMGHTIPLHTSEPTWWIKDGGYWELKDNTNAEQTVQLWVAKGDVVQAGVYEFDGYVAEYL